MDWYDKKTELAGGKEYSKDMEDDLSIISELDLESEPEIYDGGFDVLARWIPILQPFFDHPIDPEKFDYQIAFRHRTKW
ncbi:colicin E3-like toxin immunity protein [Pseudomonas sp. SMN5]|uniref:colicin E3-like toxin immunity protein n=1 Tax=Pseudomonas sp. SMN5 TaxID=3390198 RepID=UPI003F87FDD3